MVGVLIPEADLAAGSSPITMEERIEGGRNGLRGCKGLGKCIVPVEGRGVCTGETEGEIEGPEGAARGVGNLTGGSLIVAGGECTG